MENIETDLAHCTNRLCLFADAAVAVAGGGGVALQLERAFGCRR